VRFGDLATTTPAATTPLHPTTSHWIPLAIALGGGLTAAGFILSARGAKHLGTLLYVTAIMGTAIVASLRCYQADRTT
jgi:hypothetical protein